MSTTTVARRTPRPILADCCQDSVKEGLFSVLPALGPPELVLLVTVQTRMLAAPAAAAFLPPRLSHERARDAVSGGAVLHWCMGLLVRRGVRLGEFRGRWRGVRARAARPTPRARRRGSRCRQRRRSAGAPAHRRGCAAASRWRPATSAHRAPAPRRTMPG